MKLLLVDYIKTHPNWEQELTYAPYWLKVTRDEGYISFMYQLVPHRSDFSIPLVRECRGLILEEETLTPVCIPFFKFFNYGESDAAVIDWPRATVSQKIDGSLIKMWYHKGEWHISTNKTINAFKAKVNSVNYKTFGDVFFAAIHKYYGKDFNNYLQHSFTYMFEVTSPDTQVVVPYDLDVYFLGYRDNITGKELWGGYSSILQKLPRPKIYNLYSLEDVIAAVSELPFDEEGYVVFDEYYNRVKIKSPEYIKAHYLRNNNVITWKRLIEVVLSGEEDEFLVYYPDQSFNLLQVKKWMLSLKYNCYAAQHRVEHHFMDYIENIPKKDLAQFITSGFEKGYIRSYLFKSHDIPSISWQDFTKSWSVNDWHKNFEIEGYIK